MQRVATLTTYLTILSTAFFNVTMAQNEMSCDLNKPYEDHSQDEQADFYEICVRPEMINTFETRQIDEINDYPEWLRASSVPTLTQAGHYQLTYVDNPYSYETYISFDESKLPEKTIVVTENFMIADNGTVTPKSIDVVMRHDDERIEDSSQKEEIWEFMQFTANGEMQRFTDYNTMCGDVEMPQNCFDVPKEEVLMH